jgi:zinc protease
MKSKIISFLALSLGIFGCGRVQAAGSAVDAEIDIPYTKTVLSNGLTLIVHEDHKAPIVAVDLWYHVGSKNEKPGKTGFAHLFEHMMYSGSEHFRGTGGQNVFFEAMERVGATDMNGTTANDRTDFFENVPRNALDVALWIESDRMGHLLGSIDKVRLDTQRGVVQNEKRQGENQPYAVAWEMITKGTMPAGHPYSWTVIGSMEDLNAASIEDIKTWFTNYYGAANVVLVVAGDIDPATARSKVEKYFGDIPSGPPVARYQAWVPEIAGTRRAKVTDHVPQTRIYKVWNVPQFGEAEATYLDMASDVLVSSSKSSRLYKRLVYDDQTATDVGAYMDAREICGQFDITATVQPGGDPEKVEHAIDEEVARFIAEGPTEEELQRVKAEKIAGFVRGIERIGGFGGKADVLAMNQTYRGTPDYYKTTLKYTREATVKDLQAAAKRWLTDNVYILQVDPFPKYQTAESTVDRSKIPAPDAPAEVKFPPFQRSTLSNGMKVILAERHALPLVSFRLLVDAGYAADQFAIPGAGKLTMQTLDEGTSKRTAIQISDELLALGATIDASSSLDTCTVSLSTLTSTLDPALDIYADVILNPAFPEADFQRQQKQLLAGIQQEKNRPVQMGLRVFPKLLYGTGHAYGNPLTGSGTEESVARMSRTDLVKFHEAWFKANNATLIIVGDTTLAEITPKLEKAFAAWKPGDVPVKNLANVEHQPKSVVYLIDKPDSLQSVILAGHVGLPKSNPDEIAIETMNTVLGGAFTSRINMNLREDKHWAYGAGTFAFPAKGQGPFIAFAPVQADKTKESMIELNKELHGILSQQPVTLAELTRAQQNETLSLPGNWETIDAVSDSIGDIVRFGLPDDYYATYSGKVRGLSVDDVNKAAQKEVHADQLVWVVIGDRAKIEAGIRELGWGEIHFLDADGNPLK